MMDGNETLLCGRCNMLLQPARTDFSYLGHTFHADLPCCPECGQIFISEELVQKRIVKVEMMLEDK